MDSAILEKVKKIVATRFNIPESEVNESLRFVEDLHADSLDSVELMMQLEDVFDIEISDADSVNITTVGKAVEYISLNKTTCGEKGAACCCDKSSDN